MTFVDGNPIDAAQLNALETALADLKASMPKVGTGTAAAQLYGGSTSSITLSPATPTLFKLDFSAAQLAAVPSSIVVTPVFPDNGCSVTVHLVPGSVTSTGASCEALLSIANAAKPPGGQAVTFNYILIA